MIQVAVRTCGKANLIRAVLIECLKLGGNPSAVVGTRTVSCRSNSLSINMEAISKRPQSGLEFLDLTLQALELLGINVCSNNSQDALKTLRLDGQIGYRHNKVADHIAIQCDRIQEPPVLLSFM